MSIAKERNSALSTTAGQVLSNERGMTLIEIMIVVAIVAGLMAVLGSNVSKSFKESRVKQTKIQIVEIGKQLEAYNLTCGSYPTTEVGLKALVSNPGPEACPNWGPEPYYKTVPKDQWSRDFIYESDGGTYLLKSLGEDRKDGGEGYAKDLSNQDA